uniref:PilS cassette n=1 Tax=Steinernema glaseri TaxID=37863 RepID=A0A1I8AGH5_9BILA
MTDPVYFEFEFEFESSRKPRVES